MKGDGRIFRPVLVLFIRVLCRLGLWNWYVRRAVGRQTAATARLGWAFEKALKAHREWIAALPPGEIR